MDSLNFPQRARQRLSDPFLQTLLIFSQNGLEFSLMLSVNGQIIRGTATSRDRWFELWREEVRGAGGDALADAFESLDENQAFIHEDELPDSDRPRRVYLRDAKMGLSGGSALIRVQLDAVDAWSMGNTRAAPKSADDLD